MTKKVKLETEKGEHREELCVSLKPNNDGRNNEICVSREVNGNNVANRNAVISIGEKVKITAKMVVSMMKF